MDVQPITAQFAAEVADIDLVQPLDATTVRAIWDAIDRYAVLVFHDQRLTDVQLRAYEQMLEPKKLVTVEGGHFDPYLKQFSRASDAAVSWFRHHLGVDAHKER